MTNACFVEIVIFWFCTVFLVMLFVFFMFFNEFFAVFC